MRERGYSRRHFMIAGATMGTGALAALPRLAPAAPTVRPAGFSVEDLPVAGALLASPLADSAALDSALIEQLRDRARGLGAQLHSPVPAGTRLGYWGQPLGIVLAPERPLALNAAARLSDELQARLAGSVSAPILQLGAALPQAHTPRSAAAFDVLDDAAESAFAAAPYRLRETYHSAAQVPTLAAPISVLVGAHLPLPQIVLSHPPETALRQSLADWSKLPAGWFRLAVASPSAEPALFEIPAKLAWSASSKLRRPVELVLTPEQTRVAAGQHPEVVQTLSLGAERDGRLRSLVYRVLSAGPRAQDRVEPCGLAAQLYAPVQRQVRHQLAPLAIGPIDPEPRWGYIEGSFALESALDELASLLQLDPGTLRLRNLPPDSPTTPSAHLRRALSRGRELLGWPEQSAPPARQREGTYRIGQGLSLGHLPLPSASGSSPAIGYVAHLLRLRVPDGQSALQVLRHIVVLALPQMPSDLDLLRESVRRAIWSAWERSFTPAPAYDPQTGAPLPTSSERPPGLTDAVIEVEFIETAERSATRGSGTTLQQSDAARVAIGDAQSTAADITALAQCGAVAALANALYSATGYRQRSVPFDRALLARPTPTP